VRGRRDARWLPSRYRFALFRLWAYFRARRAAPEPANTILIIDRDQSASEQYVVGAWVFLTTAAYLEATLFRTWAWPLSTLAAIACSAMLVELPFFLGAPVAALLAKEKRQAMQSAFMMALYVGVSLWLSTSATWARYLAWLVLAVTGLNAIAWVIVQLLRGSIARLESSFGGSPSAA
jgi:hypothetical protein